MAAARRIDVFFYGLFMDPDLLRTRGLEPAPLRVASVPGFALRVGRRAALVPSTDNRAYGVVTQLTHEEIERLYADPSVQGYRPEGVLVELEDGTRIAALCYNLAAPESAGDAEPSYAAKLRDLARHLNLPADYVAQIH
jgi:hypothetical protein